LILANAVCCHGSPWLGQQMQFDRVKRREFITLLGGAMASSGISEFHLFVVERCCRCLLHGEAGTFGIWGEC
jgi:hypothetical protein